MIDGKQNILAWFENTGMPYWAIYPGKNVEGGNYCAKMTEPAEGETPTLSEAYNDLARKLALISSGQYTIVANVSGKITAKGTCREEFRVSLSDNITAPPTIAPVIGINGPPEIDIEARINSAVKAALMERDFELLKKENQELKSQVEELDEKNPMNRIGSVIADILPVILPSLIAGNSNQQPTAKVAGLTAQNPIEMQNETFTENDQEKLEKVIEIFSEIDPKGWLDKLLNLAEKVKAKPFYLDMIEKI